MNLRFLYAIVFSLIASIIGFVASIFSMIFTMGMFWLLIFGDSPWPEWTNLIYNLLPTIVFILFIASGTFIGLKIGKGLEKNSDKEKPKKKAYYHLMIAIFIWLAFTVLVLLYFSTYKTNQAQNLRIDSSKPLPNNTQNWQTYRNDELGFEMRYPVGWTMLDNAFMPASYIERCRGFLQPGVGDNCMILAVGGVVGETFTFLGIGSGIEHTRSIAELATETLGSNKPHILDNTFEGIGTKHYFLQKSEGSEYVRIYYSQRYDQEREENAKIVEQILSTFRFVETSVIQWNWEPLGCGSQAPCSYRVSSSEWPRSYVCAGKYNPLSGQGEITPTPSTDPRTTTDFNCQKE